MSKKKDVYKECCEEIIKITFLNKMWKLTDFIDEEGIDITQGPSLLSGLKEYRQRLELDNHIILDDEETDQLVEEGIKIHSLISKLMLYGNEN